MSARIPYSVFVNSPRVAFAQYVKQVEELEKQIEAITPKKKTKEKADE